MSAKNSNSAGINKLKILALHGYRQNGEVFRQKTGSFRKIVNKYAEFTYVTAPHIVTVVNNAEDTEIGIQQSASEEQYGWFFNREDGTYRGIRQGGPAIGYEDSIRFVEECFEKNGPFDGIFSFSQGACFTGLLCTLQQRKILKANFNFAIMAASFKSNCESHVKYYSEPINVPSVHVFGETDKVIPSQMSVELTEVFENPVIVMHAGGHYVPAGAEQKQKYLSFFKEMWALKQSAANNKTGANSFAT